MTLQDFNSIPELRKQIAHELLMVENCHEIATGTTARLTGMPSGGGGGSKIENAVVKAEAHYERYCKLQDALKDIFTRLRKESEALTEQQRKVIDYIYPQNRKAEEIAKEMNISVRHVYRLKKEALDKLITSF